MCHIFSTFSSVKFKKKKRKKAHCYFKSFNQYLRGWLDQHLSLSTRNKLLNRPRNTNIVNNVQTLNCTETFSSSHCNKKQLRATEHSSLHGLSASPGLFQDICLRIIYIHPHPLTKAAVIHDLNGDYLRQCFVAKIAVCSQTGPGR